MDSDNQALTTEELKTFQNYLDRMVDCPNCKNKDNVRVHVVGKPSAVLINIAKKTKRVVLAGCIRGGEEKNFSCSQCGAEFNK